MRGMADTAFDTITALLRRQAPEAGGITRATRVVADLQIDSVDVFDLIMDIEDAYEITIPMELVAQIHTVGELTDAVERLIDER